MKHICLTLLGVLLLVACVQREGGGEPLHSMYYWRTTMQLDSVERQFLARHAVKRLYVRYFDVIPDERSEAMPNATIEFEDGVPEGVEPIPVVYIVNDVMRHNVDSLPRRILKRVLQMNETNDVHGMKELQIDCDWTMKTQKRYFAFLRTLRELCHAESLKLTTTIRLHQLSLEAPPADGGVLMMYNTGDVTRLDVQKPILDMKDVRPYLHHLPKYKLPLTAAYPLFTWHVLFRRGKFVGIMYGKDDLPVLSDDSIVVRQPERSDILEARRAVDDLRPDANREVILYDLSNKNIQRFNSQDYETIFNGD